VANAGGNTAEVNGNLEIAAYESMQINGNTVNVAGALGTVFRFIGTKFTETAVLSGNTVTANTIGSGPSHFILATGITLGGNRIEVRGNTISLPFNNAVSRSDSRNYVYAINTLDDGEPVKEYPEDDSELDVSGMENVIYLSASNDFSTSLNISYLRGGVKVISYFTDTNVQDAPEDAVPEGLE
jgi:hypothetical protein